MPPHQLVVFLLDERRYALRLAAVERIFRVAEIAPLPKAPGIVLGVVNVRGRIVPVVSIRRRFGLPEREIELSDHLILARTARRAVALLADAVLDVVERRETEMTNADTICPGLEHIEGVAKLEGGLMFLHNLDTFLSLEEEEALEAAMTPTGNEP